MTEKLYGDPEQMSIFDSMEQSLLEPIEMEHWEDRMDKIDQLIYSWNRIKFSDYVQYIENNLRREIYKGVVKMFTQEIKIKYFTDKIEKLTYIGGSKRSNWIDLRAAETIELKAGDFKLIPLGVAMKLPDGYEAHIAPRSSTFKTWGILQCNSVGVVDQGYCGNDDQWMMPVYATRDTVINVNDRVCQFRIIENQPEIEFIEVEYMEDESRGGFGSSGKQ